MKPQKPVWKAFKDVSKLFALHLRFTAFKVVTCMNVIG